MTIKPHLLFSSLIHAVLVAYLVSIPIYRGSLTSISFRPYLVDLVTLGRPATSPRTLSQVRQPATKISLHQQSAATMEKAPEPQQIEAAEAVSNPHIQNDRSEEVNETIPEGITMIPNEPKKVEPKQDTMIAQAEVPVIEKKPAKEMQREPEKKPEPPKVEPVLLPPPESKTAPDIVVKELALPKEPAPAEPSAPKPSKVDSIEKPSREEFPVKVDEKAEDILPSARTATPSAANTPESLPKTTEPKKESEGAKMKTASTQPPGTAPIISARGAIGETVSIKKTEKKMEQKSVGKASGQLSAQKSESDLRSGGPARSDRGGANSIRGDSKIDEGKGQTSGTMLPNAEKPKEEPQQKPPFGIAVSDALFHRDIKIEVSLTKERLAGIQATLHRRPHPSRAEYGNPVQQSVELSQDLGTSGKPIFFVEKAEKGLYTFVIENTGENMQRTSFVIHLLEGKKGARNRTFEAVSLQPQSRFAVKFILPEAIFWDDESYFTGTIESSDSITKFNDATGIVWKEEKEE